MVKTDNSGQKAIEILTNDQFQKRSKYKKKICGEFQTKFASSLQPSTLWNRSLPNLNSSPVSHYTNLVVSSPRSENLISYGRSLDEASSTIQYFTPLPSSEVVENSGYCTWSSPDNSLKRPLGDLVSDTSHLITSKIGQKSTETSDKNKEKKIDFVKTDKQIVKEITKDDKGLKQKSSEVFDNSSQFITSEQQSGIKTMPDKTIKIVSSDITVKSLPKSIKESKPDKFTESVSSDLNEIIKTGADHIFTLVPVITEKDTDLSTIPVTDNQDVTKTEITIEYKIDNLDTDRNSIDKEKGEVVQILETTVKSEKDGINQSEKEVIESLIETVKPIMVSNKKDSNLIKIDSDHEKTTVDETIKEISKFKEKEIEPLKGDKSTEKHVDKVSFTEKLDNTVLKKENKVEPKEISIKSVSIEPEEVLTLISEQTKFDKDVNKKISVDEGKLLKDVKLDNTSNQKESEIKIVSKDIKASMNEQKIEDKPVESASADVKSSPVDGKSKESLKQNDQLTDILIDMLIEQETNRSLLTDTSEQFTKPDSLENVAAAREFLQKEQKAIDDSFNKPQLSAVSELCDIIDKDSNVFRKVKDIKSDTKSAKNDKVVSYVTTPTMQRRKIGGSQRLSREERPALMEISHLHNESSEESDEENYIVTEPPEKEKSTQSQRKVQFRLESEEDSNWQGSEELEEAIEFEEIKDDTKKETVQFEIKKQEKGGKETISGKVIEETVDTISDKEERKIRRVERRFERMASETLEADPVADNAAEGEFQRMISQLSTEEVNECLQLWDEGGLTPSSELDSKDATEGDLEDEFEQLPQAPSVAQVSEHVNILDNDMANILSDIPSSVYWSFTDKPLRSSVVVPEDLAVPIAQKNRLKINENSKIDLSTCSPILESPQPLIKINTLGQSYKIDSPELSKDINLDINKEFIKHEESSRSLVQQLEQGPTDKSDSLPKPTPRISSKSETLDDSMKQTELDITETQDYSVKKKFWEQLSSGSVDSETRSSSAQDSSVTPPIPRPRSSIASNASLLKSEAESDTETSVTTLSDSTIRLKNVQQDALSKQSFTGSSDASDKEEGSEADAIDSATPASVPTTVSAAVPELTDKERQIVTTESSDSEAEYLAKLNGKALAYDNNGFVADDEATTTRTSKILREETLGEIEKLTAPVAATRKTVYERSVSLPTDNLGDVSASSVRAKKRFFEAQIKKEMVVDQLMTQLEEESSPEHKSINQKEQDMPAADPEAMMSRQIHSHIFSHELDEQIESLVPENKVILEIKKEVTVPVKATEVTDTHDKVDAKKTVKRTDSKSFEAEIITMKQIQKDTTSQSKDIRSDVTSDELKATETATASVRDIRSKFEKKTSEDKTSVITEEENQPHLKTDFVIDKTSFTDIDSQQQTYGLDKKEFEFLADDLSGMAEVMQYKCDVITKPSDSLEVHIDKSEIEQSEKVKDIEEELKYKESVFKEVADVHSEDEPIPSITVTLSGKQRTDSYSPGDSEDTQSESDITPEEQRDKDRHEQSTKWDFHESDKSDYGKKTEMYKLPEEGHDHRVHTPEEHIPDTVWEVPVQQEPDTVEQEIVQDIPIEKQIIVEKDEEDSSECSELKHLYLKERYDISEKEAREIAEQVLQDIEVKLSEKSNLLAGGEGSDLPSDISQVKVSDYLEGLGEDVEVEAKFIESVLAKKQREQILKVARTDTTTSSMEITDEDLRSSIVETDSSIENLTHKLYSAEDKQDNVITEEFSKSFKDSSEEVMREKEVLEKTLAEVKESLEAAQEELIEEHKKKQDKIQKKESPSEFEFKVLTIDKSKDQSIEESKYEDIGLSVDGEKCKGDKVGSDFKIHVHDKEDSSAALKELSLYKTKTAKDDLKLEVQEKEKHAQIAKSVFTKEVEVEKVEMLQNDSSEIKKHEQGSANIYEDDEKQIKTTLEKKIKFTDSELVSEIFAEDKERSSSKIEESFGYISKVSEKSGGEELDIERMKEEDSAVEKTETVTTKVEDKIYIGKDGTSVTEKLTEKHLVKSVVETTKEHVSESRTISSTEIITDSSKLDEFFGKDEMEVMLKTIGSEKDSSAVTTILKEVKRTLSEDSQKSLDESIKSPTGAEDVASSSSSSGRRGDSDTMHTLERPDVVMRRHKTDHSTGDHFARKRSDRRSGADYEPYSSSGESHYHSFEQTSESVRTPSRPCSSDVEGLIAGIAGTTGSSEYESAISHEASARSGTSHEFHTAVSSLSSRESMKSLDSESSGNLASGEISSEASETLVPSAMELEKDMDGVSGSIAEEEGAYGRRSLDQFDKDIPTFQARGESPSQIPSISEGKDSASFDNSADDIVSEDEVELEKDKIPHDVTTNRMKRSHEMTFQPEPRTVITDSSILDDKLSSSLEETGSVLSLSSVSDTTAIKTVIELSRTESEKMDGSATSDQLSLTVSGTSEQLSLSSESKEEVVPHLNKIETSTSTQPVEAGVVSSVTITTSSVKEEGIQSVCTQVTSQTEAHVSDTISETVESTEEGYTQSNGPAQVEYSSEYDDVKEVKRRPGHRRHDSTSFKPSMIPVFTRKDPSQPLAIGKKIQKEILEDTAESDKYSDSSALTIKEGRNDEKKDIDESEKLDEESYHTEADQGFHRDLREARFMLEDTFNVEDDHEDLKEFDSSRPQSQVSKSDSESGCRHISSGLSDDRPDSELAELIKQCSSDATIDDPIERPKTPEPAEECEIKDDTPEFSSEAQASVTELELEYCSAFSRSVEYEAHVSPIHEKPSISFDSWDHRTQEHEDDMAEAEAAFQMVPHISPTIPSALPETILEDPVAEKHELETREIPLKDEMRQLSPQMEATTPGSIPDITVTQHMAPLIDSGFHYPDLELEEAARAESTPQTPASISSKASTETEYDQGREYILHEQDSENYIAEEPETADISATTEEKSGTKHETVVDQDSATDSPGSDSFELLEKPDLADDFVIIEEVGKEAHEQDEEGKSVRIGKKRGIQKKKDEEDIVTSPPAPATRMTDLKYYPPVSSGGEDVGPFPFESESPPVAEDLQSGAESQEGSPPSDEGQTYDTEIEAGKKWIEMQFQDGQATAVYGYDIEFEHGPLEDIKEEEAADFESSSKIGSVGSQVSQSVGSFGSIKESLSSTPDYDVLAGRKYFTRSGEHDDVSMSSLQEFERLENMIALESTKTKSLGSQDSLNSSGQSSGNSKRHGTNRSGGDDISLSSLKEFEGLEHACIAAERIESKAKEEEALLSEIEEGHESQASESESCETISAGGIKGGDSDSDDYEKRMFEIDEIIRQAQTNVERFVDVKDRTDSYMDRTESVGRGDSFEEVAKVPDLDLDQPLQHLPSDTVAFGGKSYVQQWTDESLLVSTTDSLEIKHDGTTSVTQDPLTTSTDSLEIKTPFEKSAADVMSVSTDSIEYQLQQKKSRGQGDVMTDSIELALEKSQLTSDSLDVDTVKHTDSIDEEEYAGQTADTGVHDQSSSSGREGDLSSSGKEDSGEHNRIPPPRAELMLGSTDSLEPSSSTATHATYHYETDSIMSSSFTSGGSNTMVSSTETLDSAARAGVWFEDGRPYVTEVIEPETDGDFSHTIHRTVEMPPEVHKVSFQGPDAEKALREYVEHFAPGEDMTETQDVDEDGNIHIKRVVQRRIVIKPDQLTGAAAELSGPELEQYIKNLTEEQMLHDLETFDREPTDMTESDYSHLMSSIAGSTSPSHSTETHRTYVTRHVISTQSSTPTSSTKHGKSQLKGGQTAEESGSTTTELAGTRAVGRSQQRPSLKYDISMDEDPEFDPREHDWRFNLPSHYERDEIVSEQLEALEKSSATDKPSGSGSSGASPGSGKPPTKPFL